MSLIIDILAKDHNIAADYNSGKTLMGNIKTLFPQNYENLVKNSNYNPFLLPNTFCKEVQIQLAKRINPILHQKTPIFDELRDTILHKDFKKSSKRLSIKTQDGEVIDALHIGNLEAKRLMLFVIGSGCCYEDIGIEGGVLRHFVEVLIQHFPDIGVVIPNTRGVGASTGAPLTYTDLYLDIQAVVDYLHQNLRYPLKDIVLYSHSLGGVAGLQDYGLNLIIDRTFSSLPNIISNKMGLEKDSLPAHLIEKSAKFFGWDANLVEKIKQLAKKTMKIVVLYAEKDDVIPLPVSLGKQIEEEGLAIETVRLAPLRKNGKGEHVRVLNEAEIGHLRTHLERLYTS